MGHDNQGLNYNVDVLTQRATRLRLRGRGWWCGSSFGRFCCLDRRCLQIRQGEGRCRHFGSLLGGQGRLGGLLCGKKVGGGYLHPINLTK